MKKSTTGALIAAVALSALVLTSCAGGSSPSDEPNSGDTGTQGEVAGLTGTIGAKDFSEQYILAHMTSELLNAHGASTDTNTKLAGSASVRQALETDKFLGYWEYTGTSWISYNKNTDPVPGEEAQFEATKEADAAHGIAWLDPAPFNNTYALGIRAAEADRLGLEDMSQIASLPVSDQTFCVEAEFAVRTDGWPGVAAAYGIDVPEDNVKVLDGGLAYAAAQKGDPCTFGEVFATDGRIKALDLTVLNDDKAFFPVYQGAFTLKQATLDEYPGIADVLAQLSPLLTSEVMQELNSLADTEGLDPAKIAHDFLTEQGLI